MEVMPTSDPHLGLAVVHPTPAISCGRPPPAISFIGLLGCQLSTVHCLPATASGLRQHDLLVIRPGHGPGHLFGGCGAMKSPPCAAEIHREARAGGDGVRGDDMRRRQA